MLACLLQVLVAEHVRWDLPRLRQLLQAAQQGMTAAPAPQVWRMMRERIGLHSEHFLRLPWTDAVAVLRSAGAAQATAGACSVTRIAGCHCGAAAPAGRQPGRWGRRGRAGPGCGRAGAVAGADRGHRAADDAAPCPRPGRAQRACRQRCCSRGGSRPQQRERQWATGGGGGGCRDPGGAQAVHGGGRGLISGKITAVK